MVKRTLTRHGYGACFFFLTTTTHEYFSLLYLTSDDTTLQRSLLLNCLICKYICTYMRGLGRRKGGHLLVV